VRRTLRGSVAALVALSVAAVGRPAAADGAAPIGVTVSPTTLSAYGQTVTVTGDPFPGAFGCRRGRILATVGAQQPSEAQVLVSDVNLDQPKEGATTWSYTSGVGFDDGLGNRTPFGSGTYTILLDCTDDRSQQAYYTTSAEFTVLASATTTTTATTVASSTSSSSSVVATSTTLPGTTGTVDPSTATAGVTSITVRGGGFKPGATLQISLKTTPPLALGTTTATDTGAYAASLKLPASAPAGSQQLVVTGPAPDGTTRSTTATLTVVAASAASSSGSVASGSSGSTAAASGTLPQTGADHASVEVMAGLTALTLGALLVGLSHPAAPASGRHRRRRRSSW
jgi:LPXTG-motif cell wall-anchored protein